MECQGVVFASCVFSRIVVLDLFRALGLGLGRGLGGAKRSLGCDHGRRFASVSTILDLGCVDGYVMITSAFMTVGEDFHNEMNEC